MTLPLAGMSIVTLAPNVPGPVAAARLRDLGATVTKIEPPAGDLLSRSAPVWYAELHAGIRTLTIDAKTPAGAAALASEVAAADGLLTSSRLSALERLGLGAGTIRERYPRLCHVAIVGFAPPDDERAGHDLNYVGELGLVRPPEVPPTLIADLAGAERAVSAMLGLFLRRERSGEGDRAVVSLRDAALVFGEPLAHGLTGPGGSLGGEQGVYGVYATQTQWIAVAALEPHFARNLAELVGNGSAGRAELARAFAERSAAEWVAFGAEHDLPISIVRPAAVIERTLFGV